jgi:hypothetical protein
LELEEDGRMEKMNESEQLYKIIFFHNLDFNEKQSFLDSFPQFLPNEMKSFISVLEIPSGREAEIVYPVMLPKFAIYCFTFNMVSFHERTEEHLQSMRHELETIVQYCCNRKDDFDEKDLEWALKYPKVLLLGIADDEYRKQTDDNNYEKINEKILRLWKEFSFLSSSVIVPAVNNLLFHPISLFKPYLKLHFSLSMLKKDNSSPNTHPITNEISSYFRSFHIKYLRLFQSLTSNFGSKPLIKYVLWERKLRLLAPDINVEQVTKYFQSFNLLTWTNAFQSIHAERTAIDASIIILKPFTFFSNLSDCLLKLNKTVKPNLNDKDLSQLVSEWNTKLDQTRERRRFCDLGVVSEGILLDLLKDPIVNSRMQAPYDELLIILKALGIITTCNQEFNAPTDVNLATVPDFTFIPEKDNEEKEDKRFLKSFLKPFRFRSKKTDGTKAGDGKQPPSGSGTPLVVQIPDSPTVHIRNRTQTKSGLAPESAKIEKANGEFYYFLPYLPATAPNKLKTMKKITSLFYFALVPKESNSGHLSELKFSFQDIKKISSVPNYFMQRLTAKAEWYQKFFRDSVKKQKTFQNTDESVSQHNFSIFSPTMGFHPYINNTDVVWDDKFQLIQVSYDENSCNPHDTLTFLLHMMEDVIYEFHYGLEVLPLVSYPSVEDEKLYLFSLKQLKIHFGDHFLSMNSVPTGNSKIVITENVSLPRLLLSLFSSPTNGTSTQVSVKKTDLKKKHHQNYMFDMLKKNFYFYFQFYYETAASRAVIHVSCPPTLKDKSDIQKYVTTDLEDKTFKDIYGQFHALYPEKEVFTCSDRPTKLADESWISSLMFSQHLLLIYRLKDFEALETANDGKGTKVVLSEELEIILYEWIILIIFMKYFYEISHIKSFRIVLLSNEDEETTLPPKNFFHEFFAPDIKFLHTPFNPKKIQTLKTKLKSYFQTMTTDYSIKHHLKDSYLTKLDNYFDSLTIPSLVMEFSHLVSMNYHSFSVMQGKPPYEFHESILGNIVYFKHLNLKVGNSSQSEKNKKENNNKINYNQPTDQLQSIVFHYLKELINLNCFAVERLHPKESKPCFRLCYCITVEGKFEDFLEKYQPLFGWIGVILTILLLWCLSAFWESKT